MWLEFLFSLSQSTLVDIEHKIEISMRGFFFVTKSYPKVICKYEGVYALA